MKKLAFVLLAMLAIGCDNINSQSPQVVSYNKRQLSGNGEEIGVLPDGRRIVRYDIWRGDYGWHFIYVVDNAITITTNLTERVGKTDVNRTQVIIDGVRFEPQQPEKTNIE